MEKIPNFGGSTFLCHLLHQGGPTPDLLAKYHRHIPTLPPLLTRALLLTSEVRSIKVTHL